MGGPLPHFKTDDVITRKNVGIDPNLFQVTINNKMNERTDYHTLRSRDGQPEDFSKTFPRRFRKGKKRITSNRFFIESKWKLPKKSKIKKRGSKPPINPSHIKRLHMY